MNAGSKWAADKMSSCMYCIERFMHCIEYVKHCIECFMHCIEYFMYSMEYFMHWVFQPLHWVFQALHWVFYVMHGVFLMHWVLHCSSLACCFRSSWWSNRERQRHQEHVWDRAERRPVQSDGHHWIQSHDKQLHHRTGGWDRNADRRENQGIAVLSLWASDCFDNNAVICVLGCCESRGKQAECHPEQNHIRHGAGGCKHTGECEWDQRLSSAPVTFHSVKLMWMLLCFRLWLSAASSTRGSANAWPKNRPHSSWLDKKNNIKGFLLKISQSDLCVYLY